MAQTLLHIGPITLPDGTQGSTLFFLHPSNGRSDEIFESSVARALARFDLPATEIVCEPGLREQVVELNLTCADELSDSERLALATMALVGSGVTDFAQLERSGLVSAYFRALASLSMRFVSYRLSGGWPEAARTFVVELESTSSEEAEVQRSTETAMVLVDGGLGLVLGASLEDCLLAQGDDVSRAPFEFVDAMIRAFELPVLPRACVRQRGVEHPLSDGDLAKLTATLLAIAGLEPDADTSSGSVDVAGCRASARVSRVRPSATPQTGSSWWSALRTTVAATGVDGPALARCLTRRDEAMPEQLRRVVRLLAWLAFRFAPERSPLAQVQVAAQLALLERGDVHPSQLIDTLEHLGGCEQELALLTSAAPDLLEREIQEGVLHRRGAHARTPSELLPAAERWGLAQPASPEPERPSLAWDAIEAAHAAGEPVAELALRCAEDVHEPSSVRARAWMTWSRNVDSDEAIAGLRRADVLLDDARITSELAERLAVRDHCMAAEVAREVVELATRALRAATPRAAVAYRALSFALKDQGRLEEALRACSLAIAHAEPDAHPDPRLLEVLREDLLMQDGRSDEAVVRWADAMTRFPKWRRVPLIRLAYVQLRRGRLDEALAAATEATEQVKGTMALVTRGHVHLLRGEWAEARADLSAFLRCPHSEDEYAFGRLLRASALEALGLFEEALDDLTQALNPAGWRAVSRELRLLAGGLPPDRGAFQAFLAWQGALFARLLPDLEHPTVRAWSARLVAGELLATVLEEATATMWSDDVVLRRAVRATAPKWLRALSHDEAARPALWKLRRAVNS